MPCGPANRGESRLRRGAPPRAGRANRSGLTGTVTAAGGALVPARNVIYVTHSDLLFLAHPGQIRPDPARTTCSAARIVPPVGTGPGMPLNGPWKPRRATIATHACTHASHVAFVSPRRFWGVFPGQPPKTRKTRQLYQNRNTGHHNNIQHSAPKVEPAQQHSTQPRWKPHLPPRINVKTDNDQPKELVQNGLTALQTETPCASDTFDTNQTKHQPAQQHPGDQ